MMNCASFRKGTTLNIPGSSPRIRHAAAIAEEAATLSAVSLNVLALIDKRPIERDWTRWCRDRQPHVYIDRFVRSSVPLNLGLPLGQHGLLAIDVDTDDPEHLSQIIAVLPPIRAAKRGKRGFTAFYRSTEGTIRTERLGVLEVLSHGTQTVIPPSIHPETGRPYVWLDPHGLEG
jgi:hypothetical protein